MNEIPLGKSLKYALQEKEALKFLSLSFLFMNNGE